MIHTARRDWAEKNPAATRAFHEAIVEAAAFLVQPKNHAKVREHIGKHIKLPPEVLAWAQISPPGPVVTEKQLQYWVGLMQDQQTIKTDLKLSTLIVKQPAVSAPPAL